MSSSRAPGHSPHSPSFFGLMLGSIGVVYGDIGTSPLYAFRESLVAAAAGGAVEQEMVLGVLSLILWTLTIIVTFKYVILLLQADNHGEGGILSLMALARKCAGNNSTRIMLLGMVGASLFYGDAIITPAISVLSAVEGLKLVTNQFDPYIIPIAMGIMVLLFAFQWRGTGKVALLFGPITLVWFAAMAWGGLLHLNDTPIVWQALNPYHAVYFLTNHGVAGLIALGAVFLAVTGAEALYADLGHFGRKPIRVAWILVVMPALMLNYLGQAALVLTHPEALHDSFYLLYPEWALLPMVILATLATIIASQAVITGAFSLTHQAIQLGFLPRLHVRYTSEDHAGQIYLGKINWLLFVGVIILIEIFQSSSELASAYGIAVTGTMLATTILAYDVVRKRWQWSTPVAVLVFGSLFVIELVFFGANLLKLFEGGFMPVLISAALIMMMQTWVRGSDLLNQQALEHDLTIEALIHDLAHHPVKRVDGSAVFLTSNMERAPASLMHNLRHNKILHEHNYLLTIQRLNVPFVTDGERISSKEINQDFSQIVMRFGFMESPNVLKGFRLMKADGFKFDLSNTSFFISRRNIVPSRRYGMPLWRDYIYIMMANSASDASDFFRIPRNRVVEMGMQMTV